jgi:hypothetical protein
LIETQSSLLENEGNWSDDIWDIFLVKYSHQCSDLKKRVACVICT